MASVPGAGGPIRVLFVANRGEIAARIERTCERTGVHAVLPLRDVDPALDLLDAGAVVGAALRSGADAVHPGYGFLSENAAFAEAVLAAGLRWVGPGPDAIRVMGDKAAARRLAASLGIPVLPGYDGDDQADERLADEAARLGFPVLVKPAGGGGGKGMRVVATPAELPHALEAARREAGSAFRDPRLLLERHVAPARHVEVQVLFDVHGSGVHLGERDCSLQRRFQKVVEETPAPNLDASARAALADAAVRLADAVGYVSAGTCEFLLDDGGGWWFLEMNTRLQVEHPVTEMVTGRDLVADQLRIAAGEPLGFEQDDVRIEGHAIEARVYAEDPAAGFVPATGRLEALGWAGGRGVRIEPGVMPGDEVTAHFDPMLAKVAAWAPDRAAALDRLGEALDATILLGLTTNLRFLRWLVRSAPFREGRARTNTLDVHWPPPDGWGLPAVPELVWAATARRLVGADDAGDPWSGGWRLNAPATARIVGGDAERTVRVDGGNGDAPGAGSAGVGSRHAAGAAGAAGADAPPRFPGLEAAPGADADRIDGHAAVRLGDTVHVDLEGRSVAFRLAPPPDVDRAARDAIHHARAGSSEVNAPMPGRVLAIHVSEGAEVAAGDPLLTLEAMKMEHVVVAPASGRVTELAIVPDDQVSAGQLLAMIGEEAGPQPAGAEGTPGSAGTSGATPAADAAATPGATGAANAAATRPAGASS